MDTKQSPTNQGLSFGRGGGVNCLVVFPTHFITNNSLLISLQISLLFTCTPALNKLCVPSLYSSNTCVPAHPSPSLQTICKPYRYGEKGMCSGIIGKRLVYGSLSTQERMEKLLTNFEMAKAYVLSKDDISDKCLRTVEQVYCNHYFKRCDNVSSGILPVPVCREACEVMVQQHCKEEYHRAHKINKAVKESEAAFNQWYFDLINCTTLPRRNGGTIPECYYPRELQGT